MKKMIARFSGLILFVLFLFSGCEPEEYTLTVTVSPMGCGSVTKSPDAKKYEEGKTVRLTANPASGYRFTQWKGDVTGTNKSISIKMKGDRDVTAVFAKITLTVSVSPSNGGTVTKTPNLDQYPLGSSVNLTANPASGYQFIRWEGDVTGTNNPTTVTMNGDKNVTAIFSKITLTVTVSPTNGGTVNKSPNLSQYPLGSTVTLTANPASGYEFTKWQGDATGTNNPKTVIMNSSKTITAVFTVIPDPLIHLSTNSLSFTATSGGTAPASKTINITNSGGGTLSGLSRSFPDGTPTWLNVHLNSSTAPAILTVSPAMYDPFGNYFGAGTYTTRIKITSSNASNSPQYINVTLTLLPPSEITAYASYDNSVMYSDLDANVANTVYSNSELGVGINYYWLIMGGYNVAYTASAIKFNIQSQIAGRSIASATLRIYVYALRGDFNLTPKIRVNAFYQYWNPNSLTYNTWKNMLYYTDGQVEKSAPSSSVVPLDFNVTTIVRNWASGAWNNYGFNLTPQNHYYPNTYSLQTTYFQSLEKYYAYNKRPQLIIQFQ